MRYRIEKNGYSAEVETHGAELKSFKNENTGVEYIWYAKPEYWNESAPWLFPVVCDLRNDRTIIEGKEYTIPIHGFACRMDFELVEQAADMLCFRLKDTKDTLAQYPFHFELEIVYRIDGAELNMELKVKNKNERPMPFFIGGHFGFNCPMFEGDRFEDMTVRFEKEEALSLPQLDAATRIVHPERINLRFEGRELHLKYDLFDNDALMFDKISSRSVSLINREGHGVFVDFADFQNLGVWTWPKKQAPYVCIEPWNGIGTFVDEDDEFVHKRCVQYVDAGETKTYRLRIREL